MISLGKKFADYSLTAGFMICLQIALLFWLVPDSTQQTIVLVTNSIDSYFSKLPPNLVAPFTALFGAVALISMFFIGLVLELIGSVAVIWELGIFKHHLERNQPWLVPLLMEYGASTAADLEHIVQGYGDPLSKKEMLGSLRIFLFWKKSSWIEYASEFRRALQRFRLLKPFSRIQALLLSYAFAADTTPRDDLLRDHLHLCVISRAVSAGLYILALESWFFISISNYSKVVGLLVVAMIALAIFLPVKAYARYCDNLFSLVLVLSSKLNKKVASTKDEAEKA